MKEEKVKNSLEFPGILKDIMKRTFIEQALERKINE